MSVSGKINLQEHSLEALKYMNPQQLVNILLPNDKWHVNTSSRSASRS